MRPLRLGRVKGDTPATLPQVRLLVSAAIGEEMTKTPDQERQARSREARAGAGGKQIALMLTPAAAAKLAAHVAKGEAIAAVVNRLLIKSRP